MLDMGGRLPARMSVFMALLVATSQNGRLSVTSSYMNEPNEKLSTYSGVSHITTSDGEIMI